MSQAASPEHDRADGTARLPRDLTAAELAALPVLESLDDLVIEDLTEDEYEKFIAALSS